ncbi:MAG: SMP-30/gluconolactonase/LRE family protein [Verrucomicrobiota bacterium]
MALQPEPAGSRVSLWGEGPIWWENSLFYVDIEGHAVIRFEPGSEEESWDVGERVGTVVPRSQGGLVIAGDFGFSALDPRSGEKTLLADPEAEKRPDNRFNDGKCDPEGRFWAGTISTVKKTGDAALYTLFPDGSVKRQFEGVTNSNGLVWSADGTQFFYIDTPRKEVLLFDYDRAAGAIMNPRTFLSTEAKGYDSSPDGMAIDSLGNLWIAFCHGGCVASFDGENGNELDRIDFPCIETTAPAFGGPDRKTLYVTTGIKKGLAEPLAGRLFAVEVDVAGAPSVPFAG